MVGGSDMSPSALTRCLRYAASSKNLINVELDRRLLVAVFL